MKLLRRLNKKIFIFYLVIQIVIGVVLSNLLIAPRLVKAWEFNASAEALCVLNTSNNVNYVNIKVNFQNNQTESDRAMNVLLTDNWTGQSINFVNVPPQGGTVEGKIPTGQTSIVSSTVTVKMTWTDGRTDFGSPHIITVNYNTLNCPQPTPTPTPTRTPTPVPPTPTRTPTPVVPTATPTITPTPIPGATATPTPTSVPPTPTPIVQTQQVLLVTEVITPTPTPQVQVLAAREVVELPKTGAADAILLGLLSLLPAGVIIRNKAKGLFKNK